jgi:hypothetical protein
MRGSGDSRDLGWCLPLVVVWPPLSRPGSRFDGCRLLGSRLWSRPVGDCDGVDLGVAG